LYLKTAKVSVRPVEQKSQQLTNSVETANFWERSCVTLLSFELTSSPKLKSSSRSSFDATIELRVGQYYQGVS